MKTIRQLAESLGVTRQTLYNAVNEAEGVSIDDLTTEKRGNTRYFDEEAEARVKEILSNRRKCKTTNATAEAKAQRKLEEAEERIQHLLKELDELKEANKILIGTNAIQAQTIQTYQEREQQKLTGGTDPKPRGRFAKAWRILTGKEESKHE